MLSLFEDEQCNIPLRAGHEGSFYVLIQQLPNDGYQYYWPSVSNPDLSIQRDGNLTVRVQGEEYYGVSETVETGVVIKVNPDNNHNPQPIRNGLPIKYYADDAIISEM